MQPLQTRTSEVIMHCSICNAVLIVNGQARLETLDEHVCQPNEEVCLKDKYVCSNADCLANKHGICWNYQGDMYGGTELWVSKESKQIFIDGLTSAIPSNARKDEAEEGYSHRIQPKTIFKTKKWHYTWEYQKTCDEDGKTLKVHRRLQIWQKDDVGRWVSYISSYKMIKYCIWSFHTKRKWDRESQLDEYMTRASWKKNGKREFYRVFAAWYVKWAEWLLGTTERMKP